MRTPLRSCSAPVALTAAVICLALASACGTREDNTLGVAFIEDRAEIKAVRAIDVSPPATTDDYQQTTQALGTGTSSVILVGEQDGFLARTFARFDATALPAAGVTITAATLDVVFLGGTGDSLPLSVAVHRVTGAWSEAGQDTIPAFAPNALDTLELDPQNAQDTLRFDVAGIVQLWVDQPDSNLGLALVPVEGSNRMTELSSSETTLFPRIYTSWNTGAVDTSTIANATEDIFLVTTDSTFVPLADLPGRMTVARGFPARGFVRFDIPDLGARATINRAEIVLYVDPALSHFDQFGLVYQRVLGEMFEDGNTSVDPTLFGNATVTADADSVVSVVTGLVASLVTTVNRGLQVRALDERPDTDYVRFHGFDTAEPDLAPRLRIWYTPGDTSDGAP